VLGLCLFSKLAFAQPNLRVPSLPRRAPLQRGKNGRGRGDWGRGRSAKLDVVAHGEENSSGALSHRALPGAHAQLVEALNNSSALRSEGSEQNLATVVAEAKEHAASVRARLPKLSIVFAAGCVGSGRGGWSPHFLPSCSAGRCPSIRVRTRSSPRARFDVSRKDISIGEREEKRVEVVLFVELGLATLPAAARHPAAETRVASTPAAADSNHSSTLGWVAVGTGGAALIGASIAMLVRQIGAQ